MIGGNSKMIKIKYTQLLLSRQFSRIITYNAQPIASI